MRVVMAGDYPANLDRISGGVESVTRNLVQALQCYSDLEIEVVTLGKPTSGNVPVRHDRATVHYLAPARAPGYLSTATNIRQIRAMIRRLQPDLVHVQVAGEYAAAACATGIPWILTLHGIRFLEIALWKSPVSKYYRGWFIKRLERHAIRRAQHVIAISPFIQETFGGQLQGAVYAIENPIDEAFYQVEDRPTHRRLLFVGRLIPRKGVHTLLAAFSRLQHRMPDSTLRLVGDSGFANESVTYRAQLAQIVQEKGLGHSVTFVGPLDRPHLLREYAQCSAVVLSSVLETAPMVLMEAMAAGKPVVSTDAGGARYLVDEGVTGLVVPPEDEQALAGALARMLGDEDCRRTMGRQARIAARQRFHASAVAARTRDVYYRVLDQPAPAIPVEEDGVPAPNP